MTDPHKRLARVDDPQQDLKSYLRFLLKRLEGVEDRLGAVLKEMRLDLRETGWKVEADLKSTQQELKADLNATWQELKADLNAAEQKIESKLNETRQDARNHSRAYHIDSGNGLGDCRVDLFHLTKTPVEESE